MSIQRRSTLSPAEYWAELGRRVVAERMRRGDPSWQARTFISLGVDLGLPPAGAGLSLELHCASGGMRIPVPGAGDFDLADASAAYAAMKRARQRRSLGARATRALLSVSMRIVRGLGAAWSAFARELVGKQ